MQITITHTRGIDGSQERLGPVEAGEKIEAKVAEINFLDLPDRMPGGDGNDIGSFTIEVDDPARSHKVSFSELSDEARAAGLMDLITLAAELGTWHDTPIEVDGTGPGDATPTTGESDMQVTAHRSGGIAGRMERLGPVEAKEHGGKVEAKVEEIHFFDLDDQIPGGQDGADIRTIAILVSDPPRAHEVHFSERSGKARELGLLDLIALLEACGATWEPVSIPVAAASAAT